MNKVQAISDIAFGKTYELSLVKGYVAHWGMAQAVRELIQNALDSDSPFVYEFARAADGTYELWLNSSNTILTPQTLLLGATSKTGNASAIGSFGEGYKIALLVLTREGYEVKILNGQHQWTPRFRMSRTFGEEILVIDESLASGKNNGLTFIVSGLLDSDVESIRNSCLRMQEDIGAIKRTTYGDILLDGPGELYVGSLFVCKTDLKYSYNIKPEHLKLERDRQTVDTFDLKLLTRDMWFETHEYERVAEMIAGEVPDLDYAEYNSPELVKEECYKIFKKNNPGAMIAKSPEDMRDMIKRGMTHTVYAGSAMYATVHHAPSYKRDLVAVAPIGVEPHVALAAFLHFNKGEMRRKAIVGLKALIQEAEKKWKLR